MEFKETLNESIEEEFKSSLVEGYKKEEDDDKEEKEDSSEEKEDDVDLEEVCNKYETFDDLKKGKEFKKLDEAMKKKAMAFYKK